jgi:uncharacterized membrane protein YfcA
MDTGDMVLTLLIFAAALLYASVGHAGASGYLAAMALFGLAPAEMKPAALVLNIFVATIGTMKYVRAGCFSWTIFWPLVIASAPFALLGGWLTVPAVFYKTVVGLVLLYAAWRLWFADPKPGTTVTWPRAAHLSAGAGIGFLSGLTGVGGGIFLSPLLLLARVVDTRQVLGISSAFILVNSAAGLAGLALKQPSLPAGLGGWIAAAVAGGYLGAHLGSQYLAGRVIRRLLAVVLVIAGGKMLWTV